MLHQRTPQFLLRLAAAAATLCLAASACDATTSDDDVTRSLPCNLADDDCAALPVAAEALVVLESMGIDPDEADVELVEDAYARSGSDPADEPARVDTLVAEAPPPEEQRWTCNGGGGVMCCCLWDGEIWGCFCN